MFFLPNALFYRDDNGNHQRQQARGNATGRGHRARPLAAGAAPPDGEVAEIRLYSRPITKRSARAMKPYHVKAEWDAEAAVWVASSEDVPGLATGADSFEALIDKLKTVVPELLEENGLIAAGTQAIPFIVTAERSENAYRAA